MRAKFNWEAYFFNKIRNAFWILHVLKMQREKN